MPARSWKPLAGLALLAFQVTAIIHARFVETRYFCWAPYDQISRFHIEATVDGRPLSAEEVEARYHLPQDGRNNHSIGNIKAHLQRFEMTYGRNDPATIRLTYSLNGSADHLWTWPR